MKHTKSYAHLTLCPPSRPNAADDQFFADRALDLLTGIVSLVGFAFALAVLITLA